MNDDLCADKIPVEAMTPMACSGNHPTLTSDLNIGVYSITKGKKKFRLKKPGISGSYHYIRAFFHNDFLSWLFLFRSFKTGLAAFPCSGRYTILSLIRAPIAIFRISFQIFLKGASPAKKITVFKGYFSKITDLQAIRSCNLEAI
jgi:hypothetical protein